jgi:hypothetical protein
MSKRYRIRPSRGSSAVAVVVGVVMLIVGATVLLPNIGNAPAPAGLFLTVWFGGGITVIVYHLINASGGNVPSGTVIEEETSAAETSIGLSPARSAEDRLRELDSLRAQRLIDEGEYARKREEILRDL